MSTTGRLDALVAAQARSGPRSRAPSTTRRCSSSSRPPRSSSGHRRTREDPVALALSHATAAVAGLREGADVLHPAAPKHGGLGPALRVIAERAARLGGAATVVKVEAVGGELHPHSAPDPGTEVRVHLP